MIELAPKTTYKLDADRAELYIYTCTHDDKYDWRFPTRSETSELFISGSWNASDFTRKTMSPYNNWTVTPVRDIK